MKVSIRHACIFGSAFGVGAIASAVLSADAADCHYDFGPNGGYRFDRVSVAPPDAFSGSGEPYADELPYELDARVPPMDWEPPYLLSSSSGLLLVIEAVP